MLEADGKISSTETALKCRISSASFLKILLQGVYKKHLKRVFGECAAEPFLAVQRFAENE